MVTVKSHTRKTKKGSVRVKTHSRKRNWRLVDRSKGYSHYTHKTGGFHAKINTTDDGKFSVMTYVGNYMFPMAGTVKWTEFDDRQKAIDFAKKFASRGER